MRLPRASLIVSALLFVGACGDESTTSEGDGTSSGSGAADFRDGATLFVFALPEE